MRPARVRAGRCRGQRGGEQHGRYGSTERQCCKNAGEKRGKAPGHSCARRQQTRQQGGHDHSGGQRDEDQEREAGRDRCERRKRTNGRDRTEASRQHQTRPGQKTFHFDLRVAEPKLANRRFKPESSRLTMTVTYGDTLLDPTSPAPSRTVRQGHAIACPWSAGMEALRLSKPR